MSRPIEVIFYDGVVSKPHHAQLSAQSEFEVLIQYGDRLEHQRRYAYRDMELIGALGQLNPAIELKDDARIEFQGALPEWFNFGTKNVQHSIWKLERSPSLIVFSIIFVVAFVFALVKWGVPAASHYVAFQLPENSLNKLGDEAEKYVLNNWTNPSHLAQGQKDQISKQYLNTIAEGKPAKLVFREGGRLGANAVALPNNTIIITDELIEMAHSDQEILGVLAHEQGHLVERHSLQQGLTSLGLSVLYIAMTGDSSDLLTSLPAAMIGANYSRKFEAEADMYALKLMDRKGIEVSHFANFLQRLSDETALEEKPKQAGKTAEADKKVDPNKKQPQNESSEKESPLEIFDALSSHPATEERVKMVRDFEKKQQSKP
ncbi:M48 family metallopeptidase [Acinetobacter guillouiae]|uniref:M48 family metallopeptidase n=1 Tax=Acinetobacter guillouiae TaxID=106649 RepID=A0A8X8GJ04_ACIGI|nr:M48 family metallopeptidase [Acinetobacter guillouiae]MCF0264199.1 M48 family metallopeptidase [Acinetobacter guillouiae]